MKNKKCEVIAIRKGVANVFGEVCKKQYDDEEHEENELEH